MTKDKKYKVLVTIREINKRKKSLATLEEIQELCSNADWIYLNDLASEHSIAQGPGGYRLLPKGEDFIASKRSNLIIVAASVGAFFFSGFAFVQWLIPWIKGLISQLLSKF